MTRVYWDTMLFVYWLEGQGVLAARVSAIRSSMANRGDRLCASNLTLCEMLAFPVKRHDRAGAEQLQTFFASHALEVLPFPVQAAPRFAAIRAEYGLAPPDALHLAIAATAGVDLFLTNDHRLHRLKIPGIDFIAGLDTNLY